MRDLPASYNPRVIVKFKSAYVQADEIPYDERIEKDPEGYLGKNWSNLVRQFPGLTILRAVTSLTPQQLVGLVQDAKKKAEQHHRTYPQPDNLFLTYFAVRFPSGFDPMAVAKALRSWEAVELAYVEGKITLPSGTKPGTSNEPIDKDQKYLCPAPDGINAKCAWKIPGGDGGNDVGLDLRFVDIEQGWNLTHQDLPKGILPIPILDAGGGDINHGTLVLGIVLAVPNGIGCVGITPNLTANTVASIWPGNTPTDVANAIAAAIPADDSMLRSGDVLLLETQMTDMDGEQKGQVVPIEVDSIVFQYIWNATVRGIVVVEAAGNGGLDLDTYTRFNVPLLNRDDPQFRESLAIMVGAATAGKTHLPIMVGGQRMHNYGSRIDCYAWGEKVYSTAGDGNYGFLNDTSAAAAIIAGAALAVQGIAQYYKKGDLLNYRFSPDQLRSILRNPATGTVSGNSTWDKSFNSTWDSDPMKNPDFSKWNDDSIGVMPNLQQIMINSLGIAFNDVTPPSPPTELRIS